MIDKLPLEINILFIATCILTIGMFHFSNAKPNKATLLISAWAIFQSTLAYFGFYQDPIANPFRFAFVILPAISIILFSLTPSKRDTVIKHRNLTLSTFLHVVRLPVEIVLFQLFLHQMIPELMTFQGRNFDILAGITAPLICLLYLKNKISPRALLVWNIIGLILVTFILINGVLSAELPVQQFAFEQPNRAITYFPYILLPAVIVPVVIWTHITDIIKLLNERKV